MKRNGMFCQVYGKTIKNRVLEFLLENEGFDFAIGDMANEIEISKPKAYQVMEQFEKKGYVKKSRIIGRTQLYILNTDNKIVQLFLKNFKDCLQLVMDEYKEKESVNHVASNTEVIKVKNM